MVKFDSHTSGNESMERPKMNWLFRRIGLMSLARSQAVSSITILLLVAALIYAWNAEKTELVILEFSREGQHFSTIHRPGKDIRSNRQLVANFLVDYLVSREKVDHATEEERVERVYALSSDTVWKLYKEVYGSEHSPYFDKNLKREINIVKKQFKDANSFEIEWESHDYFPGKHFPEIHEFESMIEFAFVGRENVPDKELFNNPIGLLVTYYDAVERRKSKKSEGAE